MADTPARPRFQFHLGTLVVCVVLTGALLGWHLQPIRMHIQSGSWACDYTRLGFPFAFYERLSYSRFGFIETIEGFALLLNFAVVVVPAGLLIERKHKTHDPATVSSRNAFNRIAMVAAGLALLGIATLNFFNASPMYQQQSYTEMTSGMERIDLMCGWPVAMPHPIFCISNETGFTIRTPERILLFLIKRDDRIPNHALWREYVAHFKPDCSWEEIARNSVGAMFIVLAVYAYSQWMLERIGQSR